jgi:TfoX/Sxy family transcriptional regulator of competence genes
MAYDEGLAQRIREVVGEQPNVSEKPMFGGICFLLKGNMFAGVVKDDLMIRVGPDAHDALVVQPHARPMDFTGRPMKGFLYVDPDGLESDADLRRWVGYGVAYAGSLPGKRGSAPNRRRTH